MKRLKERSRHNGFLYTLLDRNDAVALFAVGGTHSDKTSYYEVDRIQIRKADKYGEIREAIPSNEQFGLDRSRCFNNLNAAINYFNILCATIEKESQRSCESVIVLTEIPEIDLRYQKEAA